MQKMGGNVIELDSKKIGFNQRESNEDILKVMSQYIDVLIIRNDNHKELLNINVKKPSYKETINASKNFLAK